MEIKTELTRARLRYQCYAMREQGKCDKEHEKLLKQIEDLPGFEGWENFANTWDFKLVFEDGEKILSQPLTLVWKKFGEVLEWDAVVEKKATTIRAKKATATPGPIPNGGKRKSKKK